MSEIVKATPVTRSVLVDGYSSITSTDRESLKQVYTAISDAKSLADNIGKRIMLRHVVTQPVQSEDERTGEVEEYTRFVLIDEDGTAYAASSSGIQSSLENLFKVFGSPEGWTEALAVKVVKKKSSKAGWEFFSIVLA